VASRKSNTSGIEAAVVESARSRERYYGRFERRIPVDDVDEEKVSAAFKNGVLTLTMPKAPQAQSKVKRIAINGK